MRIGIVNTSSFRDVEYRIDPDIHLSEGVHVRNVLDHLPYEISTVGENSERVFLGNIFSRIFVPKPEYGVEYLSASDTVLSDLHTGRYISKKQAEQLKYLYLKKDWIVVTCSGTLGNVSYTNRDYEGKIVTHDLIRIVPNDNKVKRGVLYAFLSSKYGYYQITQSQFGGVVKHINDEQAKSIKIPVFSEEFQTKVDELIQESSRLREEATAKLREAHNIIESKFAINISGFDEKISIQKINASYMTRLESFYYKSDNRKIYDYITSHYKCNTLNDYAEKIFRPGIFKRQYVVDGVPFLGGSDIILKIPKSDKNLAYTQVEKMPELRIEKDWILVTCGGTIGNTVYVDEQLSKCAVSQHVLRIVPKEHVKKGYLYAYLSSEIGKKLITLFPFGSVIPQIEPQHLSRIPIPQMDDLSIDKIDKLINEYVDDNNKSKEKELLAISMVEEEIEKWNK